LNSAQAPLKLLWLENLPTHPDLTDGAVRTGVRLGKYADQHGSEAYPGPARLARETRQGLRTVKRHLAELTEAGVVAKVKVGGSREGQREATEYALVVWWNGEQTRATADTGTSKQAAKQVAKQAQTRATAGTGPVPVETPQACSTPEEAPAPVPATPAVTADASAESAEKSSSSDPDLPDYLTSSNLGALVALRGYDRADLLRLTAEYDATQTRDPSAFPAAERQRLYAGWRAHVLSHAPQAAA
jgi:hypothetical protein